MPFLMGFLASYTNSPKRFLSTEFADRICRLALWSAEPVHTWVSAKRQRRPHFDCMLTWTLATTPHPGQINT
jgi:hypothetical protein